MKQIGKAPPPVRPLLPDLSVAKGPLGQPDMVLDLIQMLRSAKAVMLGQDTVIAAQDLRAGVGHSLPPLSPFHFQLFNQPGQGPDLVFHVSRGKGIPIVQPAHQGVNGGQEFIPARVPQFEQA